MIPGLFDSPAAMRMGWALLHFLWQGAWIALTLKGALMVVRQQSSRFRYTLAFACLLLMAASPVFLLCKPQRSDSGIPAAYETILLETASATDAAAVPLSIESKPDFGAKIFQLLTPSVPWITAFWLLGTTLLLLKTFGGVLQVRVLKQKAVARCGTKGMALFRPLAVRAGTADVSILESGFVSIPTVAGWFKPVVLLPKGVLEKIDRPMLDALVAHELAHIRRRDSIMNLFQTVIEDLLFFHPAVWWVTKSVRAEREACCDDDAVALCGNALVYVHALSQAEQFRSSIPVIALSSSPLLRRIRRLTEMKRSRANSVSAFCISLMAASCILATAAGSIVLATIPPQNAKSSVSDTAPGGDKDSDKAEPGVQGAQPHKEGKYALLCGITFSKTDKETGKKVFFPPLQKDGKPSFGGCILLDVSAPKPSRVPGELQPAKLIRKVDPVYPEPAVKEHVGIRVVLHIKLNEEGLVTGAEVSKSQTVPPDRDSKGNWVGGVPTGVLRSINSAATNAVMQWKYSPTLLDGKAIAVMATVSIEFTYNKDRSPKIVTYAP